MYEVPSCRSTQDVLLKTHYCNALSAMPAAATTLLAAAWVPAASLFFLTDSFARAAQLSLHDPPKSYYPSASSQEPTRRNVRATAMGWEGANKTTFASLPWDDRPTTGAFVLSLPYYILLYSTVQVQHSPVRYMG